MWQSSPTTTTFLWRVRATSCRATAEPTIAASTSTDGWPGRGPPHSFPGWRHQSLSLYRPHLWYTDWAPFASPLPRQLPRHCLVGEEGVAVKVVEPWRARVDRSMCSNIPGVQWWLYPDDGGFALRPVALGGGGGEGGYPNPPLPLEGVCECSSPP